MQPRDRLSPVPLHILKQPLETPVWKLERALFSFVSRAARDAITAGGSGPKSLGRSMPGRMIQNQSE